MKSSFSRSFFTAATILLLALSILGAAFQLQVNEYMEDATVAGLQQDAAVIANLAAAYSLDGKLTSKELLLNLDVISQVTDADVVICDRNGFIILCSDAITGCDHQGWQVNREYLQSVYASGSQSATGIIRNLYADERYIAAAPILNGEIPKGIVIASAPTAATNQILTRISNIFLTASVFVVLLAVLAVIAFARRESRPLRDMAKAANAFAHGNLKARVKLEDDYSAEMEELALAFNNMALSLQKSEYQRQEFVANVSHELKTPMTTISGYIDGILDGTIPEHRRNYYLQIVSDETKRLSRLVRSMLDISQLQKEEGIPEEKKMHFDLEECAGQVLITFEQKIMAKNLDVQVDIPEYPVYTNACQDYITQVIYNLLDNAVKFCPDGGRLGLTIRAAGAKIYVSVSNEGETIPPEELPLVFDRFHKTDKARNKRDGWGLGLYIVKTIVCSHGEDISVSSKNGLTEFTFTLPLVN